MALWSCINQLNAGMPEKEVSLPLVHLAYHRFRNRLQNFSRILTIHPPILLSLTKGTENHNWARREMVWPLLGIFHACSPAWPPQASVEGGVLPPLPWEGEAYGPCSNWETSSPAHTLVWLLSQNTSNSCLLDPKTMKEEAPSLEHKENTQDLRIKVQSSPLGVGGQTAQSWACSLLPRVWMCWQQWPVLQC